MTCRVLGCSERHRSHYCRLCGNQDSSHYSQDCPEGKMLYHGTILSSIKGISEEGLRLSTYGRLGPGVYFTDDFQVAETISLNRDQEGNNGGAVFECNVNLRRIKDLIRDTGSEWQNERYDFAQTIHPSWYGTTEFTEFCLKDARKCSVRKVTVTEGRVDGITSLRSCVINKGQREWKELKQLDKYPTFDDLRSLSNVRGADPKKKENQLHDEEILHGLRFLSNVCREDPKKKESQLDDDGILDALIALSIIHNGRIGNVNPFSYGIPISNSVTGVAITGGTLSQLNVPMHNSFFGQTQNIFPREVCSEMPDGSLLMLM